MVTINANLELEKVCADPKLPRKNRFFLLILFYRGKSSPLTANKKKVFFRLPEIVLLDCVRYPLYIKGAYCACRKVFQGL